MPTFYLIARLHTIGRVDSVRKDNIHFPEGAMVACEQNFYTGFRSLSYPLGQVNPTPMTGA